MIMQIRRQSLTSMVLMSIDQKGDVYEKDISSLVTRDNNYLEISPLTELHIVELLVEHN